MRFSLLGYDHDVLQLTRAALEAGHELAAVFEVEEHPRELPRAVDDRPRAWEELLLGSLADFVLVSQGDFSERRADALRKLIQAGVPLLVVQPGCEAIVGFELEMIRQDTRSVVAPYAATLFHPLVQRLCALARTSLGPIEQVAFERALADDAKAVVQRALVHDAGLVRTLLGPIRKVSALGAGENTKERLPNLSVHMTTTQGTLVRWTSGRADGLPRGTLEVIGARDRATLTMPEETSAWTLRTRSGQEWRSDDSPALRAIAVCGALVESAQRAAPAAAAAPVDPSGPPLDVSTWLEGCRDVEVAETADRSLHKGKTLELYYEEHSEKNTFMGMMAAGGCLLLSVTLGLVFFIALLGGASISVGKSWPVLLLLVLGGFTLLQLLMLLFRDKPGPSASSDSSPAQAGKAGEV